MRTPVILALLLTSSVQAQNHVPNWSFEIHTDCPDNYGQVNRCLWWDRSWNNNDPTYHTEYLHACGTSMFAVPDNTWGYQAAATGEGYMAEVSLAPTVMPNYRENIYAPLLMPLSIGQEYQVSIKISHCDNSQKASNNFGVKFATVNNFPIDGICQLHGDDVVSDKLGWTTIVGTFIADSAYTYLCVGNFIPDNGTTTENACPSCAFNLFGYYVDDVCVLPKEADGLFGDCQVDVETWLGSDEDLLLDHITVLDVDRTIRVTTPQPFRTANMITLHDCSGRLIATKLWPAGTSSVQLSTENTPSGTYIISVQGLGTKITKPLILLR